MKKTMMAPSSIKCPNCLGKGCNFCTGTGKIYYFPGPNALDYIEIAYRKYKIKQGNNYGMD